MSKKYQWLVMQIGFVFGLLIGLILGVGMPTFSKVFSTDADVLDVIKGLIPVCIIFCYFTFIL